MAKIVSSEKQKQALAEVNKYLKELAVLKQMLEEIEKAKSFEIIYRIKGDRETRFCCPVSEKKIEETLRSFYRKKKSAVGKLAQAYEIVLEEKEQELIRFLPDAEDLSDTEIVNKNDSTDKGLDGGAAEDGIVDEEIVTEGMEAYPDSVGTESQAGGTGWQQ